MTVLHNFDHVSFVIFVKDEEFRELMMEGMEDEQDEEPDEIEQEVLETAKRYVYIPYH